jgi:hypothetical protein
MVDQASMNGGRSAAASADGENGSPEQRLVGGLSDFANDTATLVELQAKLIWLDLKQAIAQARMAAVLVVCGLVLINAALPVILVGVAAVLAPLLRISTGWALLLTGGVVVVAAAVVVALAARRLPPSFSALRRSSDELSRNVAWLRTVLVHSGRKVPPRSR